MQRLTWKWLYAVEVNKKSLHLESLIGNRLYGQHRKNAMGTSAAGAQQGPIELGAEPWTFLRNFRTTSFSCITWESICEPVNKVGVNCLLGVPAPFSCMCFPWVRTTILKRNFRFHKITSCWRPVVGVLLVWRLSVRPWRRVSFQCRWLRKAAALERFSGGQHVAVHVGTWSRFCLSVC